MAHDLLERLWRRANELSCTYSKGDKTVTGYTDDGKLLKEAYDTIVADTRELGALREDNLKLIEALARANTVEPGKA